MPAETPERFVAEVERRLAPLDRAILLAQWRAAAGRPGPGPEPAEDRRRRLLTDPTVVAGVERLSKESVPRSVERRLALLSRAVLDTQVEQDPAIARARARLYERVRRFRPLWHGRRVGRIVPRTALRRDPSREERRRAYYAEDPLYRPLEPALRELVALRTAAARAHGFRSYPEFRLSFDRITPADLERWLEAAAHRVPAEMRRRREEFEDRTGERGWYPWDVYHSLHLAAGLPDRAFPSDGMFGSVVAGVRRWGFPPARLRFRIDTHDLPSGGVSLAPDPPRDVRIVVHPGGGWTQYMTLFHEVGHAVHSASIRAPTHLLRWSEGLPGFGGFHEGIGRLFERIAASPAWLRGRPGLDGAGIEAFVALRRRTPLLEVGELAGWIRQELDLYLRPEVDPAERARRYGRTVLGFDDYVPRSFADAFFVRLPIYATSYFFAALLAPALLAAAQTEVGGDVWPNPRIGPWLTRNWFRDGSGFDWRPRLRAVTGRPFGVAAFERSVG